jgi:integrase
VIEKNPCKDVVRNTEKPRDRYVTDAEFDEFLKLVPPYMQIAMEISRMTGLRQGDILRLKQSNITPDGLLVKQGKTGKEMLFELTEELSTLIVRRNNRVTSIDRHLLLNSRGQPLTSSGFKTMWQRRMKVFSGDRFTFHDIRAKAGSEVENTHELLGNSEAVARKHYQRKLKPITPNW